MTARLLTVFLALWLLAGPQGAGLHLHRHVEHGYGAHSHLASSFDAGHARAHAAGAIDVDVTELVPRSGSKPPLTEPALGPAVSMPAARAPAAVIASTHEQPRLTGPPPRLRPPGQAPPFPMLFA